MTAVELHLAEPPANVLGLTISGQGYLVVFEESSHTGNPTAADYITRTARSGAIPRGGQ